MGNCPEGMFANPIAKDWDIDCSEGLNFNDIIDGIIFWIIWIKYFLGNLLNKFFRIDIINLKAMIDKSNFEKF